MRFLLGFAVLSLALTVACTNKLSGEVTVDDQPFVIESCESGQRNGFVGVDLTASDGRRLRVVQTPSGAPQVFLFAGEAVGQELGACGSFTIQFQNSTINDIKNVMGEARLDCTTDEHRVKGTVTFENCH